MSYQKVTGPLMANSHPGSYCGQDAYSDMLVVDDGFMYGKRTIASSSMHRNSRCAELYARSASIDNQTRGGGEPLENNDKDLNTVVRRLTPLECERLQGFPDGWTDIGDWVDSNGKTHKAADSPRYKAIGNSLALPFWKWLARRICSQYEGDVTIGSLFDGIGGFCVAFEEAGAKAVWASEIEEFCIAVTKKHFPEEDGGDKDG